MIVFGVSSTVALILMALGTLAYLHDGVSALQRRAQRRGRAASSLYGRSSQTAPKQR